MALTKKQLEDLGFVYMQRPSIYKKRACGLIYKLNEQEYLWIHEKGKVVFKSFLDPETQDRLSVSVCNIGDTGFSEMKRFLEEQVKYAEVYQRNRNQE